MKKMIISLIAAIVMSLSITGCKCDNCGNDKPVAPKTFSDEQGDVSEPSLPYIKPWWKD